MEPDSRSTWISSGGIGSGSVSNGAEDPYHSQASTFEGKRKAGMTAEERTNYERERNRVHARNTRARKKQYMEGLKERVENMHAQKVMGDMVMVLRCMSLFCREGWRVFLQGEARISFTLRARLARHVLF